MFIDFLEIYSNLFEFCKSPNQNNLAACNSANKMQKIKETESIDFDKMSSDIYSWTNFEYKELLITLLKSLESRYISKNTTI